MTRSTRSTVGKGCLVWCGAVAAARTVCFLAALIAVAAMLPETRTAMAQGLSNELDPNAPKDGKVDRDKTPDKVKKTTTTTPKNAPAPPFSTSAERIHASWCVPASYKLLRKLRTGNGTTFSAEDFSVKDCENNYRVTNIASDGKAITWITPFTSWRIYCQCDRRPRIVRKPGGLPDVVGN